MIGTMMRKLIAATIGMLLLLAAASYFSPHWTVYRMRSAIEARDYERFAAHVDLPALRDSFRQELSRTTGADDSGNPLEAFGRSIVRAVTAPMLDMLIQPASLIAMLDAGTPAISNEVLSAALTRVPDAVAAPPQMQLSYIDRNTVAYRRSDAPASAGSFVLHRAGWWSWRLAAVRLPA